MSSIIYDPKYIPKVTKFGFLLIMGSRFMWYVLDSPQKGVEFKPCVVYEKKREELASPY